MIGQSTSRESPRGVQREPRRHPPPPDHGEVARTLDADAAEAEKILADAEAAGTDLAAVTAELEREGVRSFCDSYHQLLDCIESRISELAPSGTAT